MAYSPADLYWKVDNEGGLHEAITGYGLSGDDLDDSDPELKADWVSLCNAFDQLQSLAQSVYDRLDKAAGEA